MSAAIPWLAFFGALFAVAETAGLIGLLIWLLIVFLGMLPLPEPIRTVITVVVALILLLIIVQRLGFL